MWQNYFKTAWRNLTKNKAFSAINISGLAIGITAFLLIISYLHFEYSYDDFNVNKDRLYRIPMEITEKGGDAANPQRFAFTFPAVAPAFKKDFPEVEEAVRFRKQWGVVRYETNKFVEDGQIYFVDPAVFKLFTYTFLKGNPQTAFADMNDAVITETTAKKYFGDADPIGKALAFQHENYIVKAVVKDMPSNAHLSFHILCNYNKYIQLAKASDRDAQNAWDWSDFYTYVLLKPGTDVSALQAKLPVFAQRHMGAMMKQKGFVVAFQVEPVKDIHLRSRYDYEMPGNGNLTYLKYLGIAAFFILIIAWINYINLSTARALDRAKEVGVRKVIGAGKWQLVRQFLAESFLVNLLAILCGISLYFLLLPAFGRLVELNEASLALPYWQLLAIISVVFFSGAVLAGAYPSFILSSFAPLQALKQTVLVNRSNKNLLRKSLVVFQFFAAIILIAGAVGFYKQLHFMGSADLGININQTLILHQSVDLDSSKAASVTSFVSEMENYPGVQSITLSNSVPGSEVGGSSYFHTMHSKVEKLCRGLGIDNKFIANYQLALMAGRNFSVDKPETETNVLLNQAAVRVFGFARDADAIGEKLSDNYSVYKIIGVVRDYHQKSLQSVIDPIVFYTAPIYNLSQFSVKISTADPTKLIEFARRQWNTSFPESPFSYSFLDEMYNAQYKNDRLFSTVLWLFTIIAMIVSSLGLFGLSLYTIAKRAKEISIRKVLGATVVQITRLIAKDYLRLILLAALPAIPVAYYVLRNWLNDYAYHISIGWWFIVTPILLIVVIAMSTVVYHSLRAALGNPAKNLRSE